MLSRARAGRPCKLLLTTFDPDVAEVSGVNVARVDALPPTVARMLTNRFSRMLWISTAIGATAGLLGMYLSSHLDVSSGATIVLVNFAAFAIVYAATAHQGTTQPRIGD